MKKTVIILVGIAASGKSTYVSSIVNNIEERSISFCADTIRGKLYGDPKIQGNGKEVFGVLFDDYTQALKDDTTDIIIIDNTSLTRELRKRYIELAETICPMFGHESEVKLVFFEANLERSLEWNKKRDRHVPEDVIRRQFANYEQADEYEKQHCKILFAGQAKF